MFNWSGSTWFTIDWTGSVEQDATVTYQVPSGVAPTLANRWFPPKDGPINNWYTITRLVSDGTSPVTQDRVATYQVRYGVYATSASPVWQVQSDSGEISGSAELPYASAQADTSQVYQVFYQTSPQVDLIGTYNVANYAEDIRDVYYDVLTGVIKDAVCTYASSGYVEQVAVVSYDVVSGVTQDVTDSYQIVNAAQQDTIATFQIITSPLTAGDNRTIQYNVFSSAALDVVQYYQVKQAASRDTVSTYTVNGGTQQDRVVEYDVIQSALGDVAVTYNLLGITPPISDTTCYYTIQSTSVQVPNVVGYTLSKAIKVLQRSGLRLGQVTYN